LKSLVAIEDDEILKREIFRRINKGIKMRIDELEEMVTVTKDRELPEYLIKDNLSIKGSRINYKIADGFIGNK
jgi:hypothetical protein